MVILVREHHIAPQRIFRYPFWHDSGILSWFALLVAGPPIAVALLTPGIAAGVRSGLAVGGVTLSLLVTFMLEFHKVGHRLHPGRTVATLQRLHLLLSAEHHLVGHHTGLHDRNYCLINGVADRTLGRLGAFRLMEWVVWRLTGAVPRQNDVRVFAFAARWDED
jgi:ubiquitin-conjugating enzyme E2 variant